MDERLSLVLLNCEKLTASFAPVPSDTPVIFLPPASIPEMIIFGPPVITKPVASRVLLPAVTLLTAISLDRSNFTLLSLSPFVTVRFALPAEKSTALSMITVLVSLPPTDSFQPPFLTTLSKSFNCTTFTASVSSLPAATPVICRVMPVLLLPTLTAPCLLFHCASVLSVAPCSEEVYPETPAALSAIASLPIATPPATVTLELAPIAIPCNACSFAYALYPIAIASFA